MKTSIASALLLLLVLMVCPAFSQTPDSYDKERYEGIIRAAAEFLRVGTHNLIPDPTAFEKALPSFETVVKEKDKTNLNKYGAVSMAYFFSGDDMNGQRTFDFYRNNAKEILGSDGNPALLNYYKCKTIILDETGNKTEAEKLATKIGALEEDLHTQSFYRPAESFNNPRYEEVIKSYVESYRRNTHKLITDPLAFEKTLPSFETVVKEKDKKTLKKYAALSTAYFLSGDDLNGQRTFDFYRNNSKEILSSDENDYYPEGTIGMLYFDQKKYEQALPLLSYAIGGLEKNWTKKNANYAFKYYICKTIILNKAGNKIEAEKCAKKIAEVMQYADSEN